MVGDLCEDLPLRRYAIASARASSCAWLAARSDRACIFSRHSTCRNSRDALDRPLVAQDRDRFGPDHVADERGHLGRGVRSRRTATVTHSTASPAPTRSTTCVASAGTRSKRPGRCRTACRCCRCVIITRGQSSFAATCSDHLLGGQLLVARLQRDLALRQAHVIRPRVLRDHVEAVVAGVRLRVDGQELRLAHSSVDRLRREHAVPVVGDDHDVVVRQHASQRSRTVRRPLARRAGRRSSGRLRTSSATGTSRRTAASRSSASRASRRNDRRDVRLQHAADELLLVAAFAEVA